MSIIQFYHRRSKTNGVVDNRGGATIAYTTDGNDVLYAIARCSPVDNFRKAFGRCKASGRLHSSDNRTRLSNMTVEQFENEVLKSL